MRPDLICVWPDTIDFPLFRKFLKEERARFAKIIIVFTETNWGLIKISQIKNALEGVDVIFQESQADFSGGDWRNNAIHKALKISDSEWIWFTEQDFFIKDGFWEQIDFDEADVIGVAQGLRLHPCCIFIKRDVLDKTTKDFSAKPAEDYDHFGLIQKELWNMEPPLVERVIKPETYYHMNGLTHNLFLISQGKKPVYKPEEFKEYLEKIKDAD